MMGLLFCTLTSINNGTYETNLDKIVDANDSDDYSTDDEKTNMVIGFIKNNLLYIVVGAIIVVVTAVVVVAVGKKKLIRLLFAELYYFKVLLSEK